jgi:hypothetical protein
MLTDITLLNIVHKKVVKLSNCQGVGGSRRRSAFPSFIKVAQGG